MRERARVRESLHDGRAQDSIVVGLTLCGALVGSRLRADEEPVVTPIYKSDFTKDLGQGGWL